MITTQNQFNQSVFEEATKISEYFLSKEDKLDNIGIYTGSSGECLLMYLNYKISQNPLFYDKLNEILNESLEFVVDENSAYNFSFASGLPGWAWMLRFLVEKDLLEYCEIEEFLQRIDIVAYEKMLQFAMEGDFDPIHGAVGIGNYFIMAKDFTKVKELLYILDSQKLIEGQEIKWPKKNFIKPDEYSYDFGLAHGMAGILSFLILCFESEIEKELTKDLIKGIVAFFENNIQDFNSAGSYFPNSISTKNYKSKSNASQTSRLAWCYGDLGILFTIYRASDILQNYSTQEKALSALIANTQRINFEETTVIDAGFCHGSCGIAYIYYKLWLKTKLIEFKNSSDFWYRKTLAFFNNVENVDNYTYLIGNFEGRKFKRCNSLLEGNCGMAISLLCYLHPDLADWDKCMLLS